MSSNKPTKMPVIDLDQLLAARPQARPRPRSSSAFSQVDPIGGITTTSDISMPFDILENDPIFQNTEGDRQEQSGVLQGSFWYSNVNPPPPPPPPPLPPPPPPPPPRVNDTSVTGLEPPASNDNDIGISDEDLHISNNSTESKESVPLPCAFSPNASGPKTPQKETTQMTAVNALCSSQEPANVPVDQELAIVTTDQNVTTTQERADLSAQKVSQRKQTRKVPAGGDNDHNMNRSDDDSSDATPPLLESSREADNAILKAIMEKIDRDIVRYEEKDLMERIRLSIVAAEESAKPGGRVCYVAMWKDGKLEEENRPLRKDPLYDNISPKQKKWSDETTESFGQGPASRVLYLEDTAKEVSRKMRLPRYAEDSKRSLISPQRLQEAVVDRILSKERNCIPRRKLAVRLDNVPSDPYSVVLHSQGHPELVEQVESQVALLISADQHPLQERLEERTPVETSRTKNRGTDRSPTSPETDQSQSKQSVTEKQRKYREFLETYNGLKEIEYYGSGLHRQHVNGCMWACHKNRYGTSCNEDCECPRDVKFLTSTVVSSHMKKELKKDPFWNNPLLFREDESPVGFVSHFTPKYFPMLELEFPDETPKKILARLVLMWREHMKIQRFGIKCNKNCSCAEGWELVFKKGRLLEGERVERSSHTTASASTSARIPRRPSTDTARNAISRSLTTQHARSIPPPLSQPKPYEVVFHYGETMGFFCITEQMKDGPVCKIASLNNSARSKDPRLQPGTVVSDAIVGVGSNMQPVRTHTDLRQVYEAALRRQVSLRLRFINTSITSSLIANMPGAAAQSKYNDWTSSGEWKGSTTEGWPGGARRVTTKEARRAAQSKDSRHGQPGISKPVRLRPSTEQTRGMPATKISLSAAPQDISSKVAPPNLHFSRSMRPAQHRGLPTPVSILRKPTVSTTESPNTDAGQNSSIQKYMAGYVPRHTKPKVNFTDSFERRFYDPKTESYRMATVVSEQQADSDLPKPDAFPPTAQVGTKDLIDAVQHKGFMDVIALLQAGACPTPKDEHDKAPKDYVKSRLEALEAELEANPGNREVAALERDFMLKRRVLSIFIDAISTIDQARFNKKWERIDFKIEKIENVRLTVHGEDHHGSKVLDCRIRISGVAKQPMPLVPFDELMGEWRNERSTKDYAFKYNEKLMASWPEKVTEIIISLYKGEEKRDKTKPIPLGEIIIPFSRIVAEIEGGSGVIKEELTPNEYLICGAISISAVKTWDKKTRESKSKETAGKLLEVTRYITQFNIEAGADGTKVPHLSAHIVAPLGGISLLHAAIYLDEPDLVKRLVELGADPAAPSDVGSARMLATNLLGDRKNDKKSLEILHILTGSAPNTESDSNGVDGHSDSLDVDVQQDMNDRSEATEYAAGKDFLDDEVNMEQEEQPKRVRGRGDDAPWENQTPLVTSASTVADTPLFSIPNATLVTGSGRSDETPAASSMTETLATGDPHLAQRSDSLTPSDINRYEKSSPASYRPRDAEMSLPWLDYWFHQEEKECIYFNRKDRCRYGKGCSKLHVSPLLGQALDDKPMELHDVDFRRDCVTTRRLANDSGEWFYTAAYRDSRAENTAYRAERGRTVGQNRQGVYWYNREDDALDALKRVVMVARTTKNDFGRSKRSQDVAYSRDSRLKMEHYERPDKRARHESEVESMPASEKIFFRALKSNLSPVFAQITGEALRKTDWTTRHSCNLVTATLIFPHDRGVRYCSTKMQGGTWFDGAWWHVDERRAKASAFEHFLQSCIRQGIVDRDCTKTKEGNRISSLKY